MIVGIVNSGIGTTASMANMFRYLGIPAEVVDRPELIGSYSHLVLPGVGHYTEGARLLSEGGWRGPIAEFVATGKPLLGVCLGMQLLGDGSEEGEGEGLGLIPFFLNRLPDGEGVSVPHMGWNTVAERNQPSPLLQSAQGARFYFVHSFAVPDTTEYAQAVTEYGRPFASVVSKDNVHGVQFHPEKSHRFGMALLSDFSKVA